MSAIRRSGVAIVLAVALTFTLVHYVRRRHLPRAEAVVTIVDGSRDRHLHGKARARARRQQRRAGRSDPA